MKTPNNYAANISCCLIFEQSFGLISRPGAFLASSGQFLW